MMTTTTNTRPGGLAVASLALAFLLTLGTSGRGAGPAPEAPPTASPAADAAEVKVASITADAAAAHPFDAAKDADAWLQRVAPAQRERARASMDRLVPVTQYLRLRPDDLAPTAVLLQRAGWPEA